VEKGLFPSERIVSFDTVDGEVSVFVPSSQVDEKEHTLKVTLLDQDDEFALIHLASQDGTPVAKIKRSDLIPAGGAE